MKILPTDFDGQPIRRVFDEATETWWFSVVDVVQVLTQQPDDLTARKYWNQLKRRLDKEGSQLVTSCHQLKMPAADAKQRLTDVATAETLLRLVQSVPSPKAEPIKLWLAKVGYERMQEMADPALSLNRARQTWQQHGRPSRRRHCQASPPTTRKPHRQTRGVTAKLLGPHSIPNRVEATRQKVSLPPPPTVKPKPLSRGCR
jgi:DNA-damage-inducible protein D